MARNQTEVGLLGLTWQDFDSSGAAGMASVRRHQELPCVSQS